MEVTEPIEKYNVLSFISSLGKKSKTEFVRISYRKNQSLVLCKLFTGRQHQIRVHLQFLGFPIIGDSIYGNPLIFGDNLGKETFFDKEQQQKVLFKLTYCILIYIVCFSISNWIEFKVELQETRQINKKY